MCFLRIILFIPYFLFATLDVCIVICPMKHIVYITIQILTRKYLFFMPINISHMEACYHMDPVYDINSKILR